ncbi:dermokine-like [Ptychodera flava]|uniref:dermokine-like n=1 Tax=Ptychodera flava TaxID=63121 RepID=UPI003969F5B2
MLAGMHFILKIYTLPFKTQEKVFSVFAKSAICQAEFGNSQQDDNHTRSNGSNSGNTGPQSIFGAASPTLPLPGESTNGGSIFSQGKQPSSNQESTSAFAMFGFNNTEDNSSTSSSAFSFNFGGGGDNSPNTSSGGFSLF